ncbi:ribosome silencing factor [Candidatus Methylacidiphilum fumarolicum]|uniref:Ribosomal silencing factor RsfS n=2 Tax=Candidatus Methylacidiphilum fumarolicum TaxID=591154 RepID=I0JW82_METFB|nr:ribosome silencing factor [Candidatus Methylacidiphilum fumarolicum]MBW6415734.1 ribosome silencing factor [Candidatus Methylacidiphilum fumarolicum]TFE66741.1 ribosome silencing factor [Candidatus Methylacidiphilum fumarolicum]TFE72180.1 ribosome silencing factor [Candidatus Methylacidiphilum fumarolicum]TFE74190.1 ribosome silencing factor [Candidatus Methylacidiphilum fumarolicum]TFE76876.1 ribosome silencing factor [Candidatus Methylacidiphilum fumarolicum]
MSQRKAIRKHKAVLDIVLNKIDPFPPTSSHTALERDNLKLAQRCKTIILEKKGLDPLILDLRQISSFVDFFVVCTATSEPHLKALAFELEKKIREEFHLEPIHIEGSSKSHWIIIDYGPLLIHVFTEKERAFYELEKLWGDAPVL